MPTNINYPDRELRFTRSNQAVVFWLLTAVLTAASITLVATSSYRGVNALLPHPGWALVPFAGALACARLGWQLTRHAYLILTPIGIEIFPFLRPGAGMNLVIWQEIECVETDVSGKRLTLHHNAEKTSGIHLSLWPISPDGRALLVKAVKGRLKAATQEAPGE
jgi:hypothetical protein